MWATLKEDVKAVFDRDPAARSTWEVVFTYPGLHAVWWHRLAHGCWRRGLRAPARVVAYLSRWVTGIEIHPGAQIGRRFFIDHGFGVMIGETAVIGDDCTIYQGVTLGGTSWQPGKRHPTLADDVVVGAGAKVLGSFTVGRGARIGANAVVIKPVPADCTAVGVPARLVKCPQAESDPAEEKDPRRSRFAPYGVSHDMPDPVAGGIDAMLEHIDALERRQDALERRLDARSDESTSRA